MVNTNKRIIVEVKRDMEFFTLASNETGIGSSSAGNTAPLQKCIFCTLCTDVISTRIR